MLKRRRKYEDKNQHEAGQLKKRANNWVEVLDGSQRTQLEIRVFDIGHFMLIRTMQRTTHIQVLINRFQFENIK